MSPILPENRGLYPADWPEIRERIRKRAGNQCERCGVPNHAFGWRDGEGYFHILARNASWSEIDRERFRRGRCFKIVCTVAHLYHDPRDCRDDVLAFLCQRCHNRHDAPVRAARRREKLLDRAGQQRLF